MESKEYVMEVKRKASKSIFNKIGNIVFIGLLLLLLFNTDAKSWLLRQMVSVGLFSAEINSEPIKETKEVHFAYSGTEGLTTSTAALKGRVVFINFWATWCPPCRAEMPSLQALYNRLKDDDRFVFLFINEDENADKANDYLKQNRFSLPLLQRVGNVHENYFTGSLPTTVVVNKKGQIVFRKEGLANYNTEAFYKQLVALL